MNYERVQLYSDLISYGLGLEILRQIPGRVTAVAPETKNCFVVTTPKDNFCLWLYRGREENLASQLELMEESSRRGFSGFLRLVPLKSGHLYGKVDEHCWFYLAEWACFDRISYRNLSQLRSIVGLMTGFRKSMVGLRAVEMQFKEQIKLPDKIRKIMACFTAFKMLALQRLQPTKFDRLYLEVLPCLEKSAAESLNWFEKSKYSELVAALKPDDLVINDFSRGNLRVDPAGQVRLLRLKNCRIDLPVMDLAALLLKSGRSQRWEFNWYEALLAEYRNAATLTTDELTIVKAYLYFPWNIYHLASRYYLNRVAWPSYLFNEKLERLIADEQNRIRLMAEI